MDKLNDIDGNFCCVSQRNIDLRGNLQCSSSSSGLRGANVIF